MHVVKNQSINATHCIFSRNEFFDKFLRQMTQFIQKQPDFYLFFVIQIFFIQYFFHPINEIVQASPFCISWTNFWFLSASPESRQKYCLENRYSGQNRNQLETIRKLRTLLLRTPAFWPKHMTATQRTSAHFELLISGLKSSWRHRKEQIF